MSTRLLKCQDAVSRGNSYTDMEIQLYIGGNSYTDMEINNEVLCSYLKVYGIIFLYAKSHCRHSLFWNWETGLTMVSFLQLPIYVSTIRVGRYIEQDADTLEQWMSTLC